MESSETQRDVEPAANQEWIAQPFEYDDVYSGETLANLLNYSFCPHMDPRKYRRRHKPCYSLTSSNNHNGYVANQYT